MIKKIVRRFSPFLLFFLPSLLFGETLKTVHNPCTGCRDYITKLSSGTLSSLAILNQSTLQSSSTFHTDSGKVDGQFSVGAGSSNGIKIGEMSIYDSIVPDDNRHYFKAAPYHQFNFELTASSGQVIADGYNTSGIIGLGVSEDTNGSTLDGQLQWFDNGPDIDLVEPALRIRTADPLDNGSILIDPQLHLYIDSDMLVRFS